MENYFITFNIYMEPETFTGSLEEAKAYADRNVAYTQQDIIIRDDEQEEICRRRWCGVQYDEAEYCEEKPITYGKFGFYADWQ